MLKRSILIWYGLLFVAFSGFAQKTYSISGLIKDKKETLPGAAVYLSGYKMATVTDNNGKFVLPNLYPGNYDILVQMIGYLPYSKNIVISDQSVNVEITLTENATMLNEIVVKPEVNREYYIELFKRYFIGKSPNADRCKILNTDVLKVSDDKSAQVVTVTASDFLIIENMALGYRIKYLLKWFELNYKTNIISYGGFSTFEEMEGGRVKRTMWQKNRAIAYNGSILHFYQALYQNKTTEEGYIINKRSTIKNPNKLPDSLVNANIKRLTNGPKGTINLLTYNGGNDSLSYWLKKRKEPATLQVLDRANVRLDTLLKTYDENLKAIDFKDELYVIYTREKESQAFNHTGLKQSRPVDLNEEYQISTITMLRSPIKFYANGNVSDPNSVLYNGYWVYENMADLLPLNYLYTLNK